MLRRRSKRRIQYRCTHHPYLVAILVAIGVFRASGAMDYLIDGIEGAVKLCGINSDFVGGLLLP